MTGYIPGIKVDGIALARPGDYDIIFQTLGCSKLPNELRCRKHNAVWIHDRCMVANAVANRMGSKILQMEHRLTEALARPTAAMMMEAKQEAHREGFLEAMEALVGNETPGRAWAVLRKYWSEHYGPSKIGPNSP